MKRALTPTKPWALVLTLMLPALSVGCTAAYAYDYCRQDVTGHMTSCSFDTLEQCQATSSGIGGDCFRDPFLKEHNAYALQLKRRDMGPAKAGTHARHR